jgi:hypothetical protein
MKLRLSPKHGPDPAYCHALESRPLNVLFPPLP